jgi:hypothetical protein
MAKEKDGTPRIFDPTQTANREAILMQAIGREAEQPCDKCARGNGKFAGGCIVVDHIGDDRIDVDHCATCHYQNEGSRCSFRKGKHKASAAKKRRVGDLDDDKQEGDELVNRDGGVFSTGYGNGSGNSNFEARHGEYSTQWISPGIPGANLSGPSAQAGNGDSDNIIGMGATNYGTGPYSLVDDLNSALPPPQPVGLESLPFPPFLLDGTQEGIRSARAMAT